jgi:uncharacterized Zn finger protein
MSYTADWTCNPFICKKCGKVDEIVEIVDSSEGYPYDSVTVKCSRCGNLKLEFV